MQALIVLELAAFLLTLGLTPVCRAGALRLGFVDIPDMVRKRHRAPTARPGGAAVVLSAMLTCCLMAALANTFPAAMWTRMDLFLRVLPGAAVVFLTGLLDDTRKLTPGQKLAGTFMAAALAVALGVRLGPGLAGAAVTVLWIAFCSNAVNLIDGVDGLAAGSSAIAAIALLAGGLMCGDYSLACAAAALLGAVGGFLAFNVSPASVFLGDSGSLTLGFLLACYGVVWAGRLPGASGVVAMVLVLALPLTDAMFAVVRRAAAGGRVFEGDRRHIHHRLLDRKFSSNAVTLVLCGFSAIGGASALLLAAGGRWASLAPGAALAIAFAGWVVRRPGTNPEPIASSLSRAVEVRRAVDAIERRFLACSSPDECWLALADVASEFDLLQVRLEIADTVFEKHTRGTVKKESWKLTVPLAGGGLARVLAGFPRESRLRAGWLSGAVPMQSDVRTPVPRSSGVPGEL